MYSGSMSAAAPLPGLMARPRARRVASLPSSPSKPTVAVTAALAAPPETSMIETPPTGLLVALACSPSLATRIRLPSRVNTIWSGPTPTVSERSSVPLASNRATRPGASPAALA